ncbi:MAG: hypothetical protein ACI855_003999 [Myxococcota bacterium]
MDLDKVRTRRRDQRRQTLQELERCERDACSAIRPRALALGRLESTLTSSRSAAVDAHNGRSRGYVVVVKDRIRQRDRVQAQLAPPPAVEEVTPVKRRPGQAPAAEPEAEEESNPSTMTRPQ